MTENEIYNRLTEIFKDILDLDAVTLTAETTADDIAEWDSLAHISLIAAIEQSFNIKFNMREIVNLHNVGELVNLILMKI